MFHLFIYCVYRVFLAYFEEILFVSYPGWALNKWFLANLLTGTFRRISNKYPTNVRVVVGGGIFPTNSVKCLVKKSSELDHKVSVPRPMSVVAPA